MNTKNMKEKAQISFKLNPSPKLYKNFRSKDPNSTLATLENILRPYILNHLEFILKPDNYGTSWGAKMYGFGSLDANIKANGKGNTPTLAIVSALAEFTERIQSFLTFPMTNYLPRMMLKPDLSPEDPDFEHWIAFNKTLKQETNNVTPSHPYFEKRLYRYHDLLQQYNPVYLDETYLISPSNGRAAGNTLEEAIVIAITEIFERFTTWKILSQQLIVPNIPRNYLSPEDQKLVDRIEHDGYEVYLKDFSLGKGFPAVGILIGRKDIGYVIKSSSDLDVQGALSRCFKDFFQNIRSVEDRIERSRKRGTVMQKQYEIFREYLETHVSLKELAVNRHSADSIFPPKELEFFKKCSDEPFKAWNYRHDDFLEDIKALLMIFRHQGYRIYVKDLSWLGFPTVMVYSPEIQYQKFTIYDRKAYFDKRIYPAASTRVFRKNLLLGGEHIFDPNNIQYITSPQFLYMHILRKYENVSLMRGLPQIKHISTNYNSWQFLGDLCLSMNRLELSLKFYKAAILGNQDNQELEIIVDFIQYLISRDFTLGSPLFIEELDSIRKVLRAKFLPTKVDEVLDKYQSLNGLKAQIKSASFRCPFYDTGCQICPMLKKCTYGHLYPILIQIIKDHQNSLEFEGKTK